MAGQGLNSQDGVSRHRATKRIGTKRVERIKLFTDTINKGLEEIEQLIADAEGPNRTKNQEKE